MGLFDTPYSVNSQLLRLKKLTQESFTIDVTFINDENLFSVYHDYFDSPCFFSIIDWYQNEDSPPRFDIEFFPKDQNDLSDEYTDIACDNVFERLQAWANHVALIMQAEILYIDPELDSIQKQFMEQFGLNEENASKLLDDLQKKQAVQYCDSLLDILEELKGKKYDNSKINEIKFDLDKIKRKIESLEVKTQKELALNITRVFGKIKLAKIGTYILDKTTDAVTGKLIGDIIDKVGKQL